MLVWWVEVELSLGSDSWSCWSGALVVVMMMICDVRAVRQPELGTRWRLC